MKVLVLSKDEMERSVIHQVVQRNGHEVLIAGNSDDAMRLVQEARVHFVIVDRTTTDADDKQFIKRIREAQNSHYIYVLLIASKVQEMDITTPRGGADDYLHKPVVPLELKSRVHIGQRILGLAENLVNAKGALEKTAMFDPLTKTQNETAFLALARGDLERARRAQTALSLIAIEIFNLETISKTHGEEVANDVLVMIAQAIREKSRPYDGVGRYGGNIFLIPLPGVIGQDAEKIATRTVKGILNSDISMLDGTSVKVELSMGIVSSMRATAAMDMEMLIEKAREAVRRSRQNGDNQVHTIFL